MFLERLLIHFVSTIPTLSSCEDGGGGDVFSQLIFQLCHETFILLPTKWSARGVSHPVLKADDIIFVATSLYYLLCELFNNTVRTSGYIAFRSRIIHVWLIGKGLNASGRGLIEALSWNLVAGTRETTKKPFSLADDPAEIRNAPYATRF